MKNEINTVDLNNDLKTASPSRVLRHAIENHKAIAISFSGAEDVVLVHMAVKIDPNIQVFCLDTGRLHAATYRFIDTVREHYNIKLELLFPDAEQVQNLVNEKGLFSFYKDDHAECCGIRKVEPLRKKLCTLDAWITGQRKDQSPDTRADIPVVQTDKAFSQHDEPLIKYNPLANWTSQDVWDYIRDEGVPFNELHKKGFISIGCEPCTRAVLPGEHERNGRWWWEESTKKECGLHIITDSEKNAGPKA